MALLRAAARDWRLSAGALFRLEATLLGRGLLLGRRGAATLAGSPWRSRPRRRHSRLHHRPGAAVQAPAHAVLHRALRLHRLCLHQRDVVARSCRRLIQGGDRARPRCRRFSHRRVLLLAERQRGAGAGEVGACRTDARDRLPPDRAQFRRADRALPEQSRHPAVQCLPQDDQGRRRRGHQDLGLRAQPQRHEPRPAADPWPPLHDCARHDDDAPREPRGADRNRPPSPCSCRRAAPRSWRSSPAASCSRLPRCRSRSRGQC